MKVWRGVRPVEGVGCRRALSWGLVGVESRILVLSFVC